MAKDELAAAVLVGSLAAWGFVHVVLAVKLGGEKVWRGLVAFLVPPLAPYLAVRAGRRGWAIVWVTLAMVWGVARWLLAR